LPRHATAPDDHRPILRGDGLQRKVLGALANGDQTVRLPRRDQAIEPTPIGGSVFCSSIL